jgi:hypothetical protein
MRKARSAQRKRRRRNASDPERNARAPVDQRSQPAGRRTARRPFRDSARRSTRGQIAVRGGVTTLYFATGLPLAKRFAIERRINSLKSLARPKRFELLTPRFVVKGQR